jgi:stage III sporulation protein AF
MAWLNGWIKELIMIILIAACADFLLPSQALQRYVRSVIGLFILLVLLSPVFEFFHHRWNANQLIGAAVNAQTVKEQSIQPLPEIMLQSKELAAKNEKQAKQLLEQQIAMNMKTGIESQFSIPVKNVVVSIKLDKEGKPSIDHVIVVLMDVKEETSKATKASNETSNETSNQNQPSATMKPVQPITIIIPDISPNAKKSAAAATPNVNAKQVNLIKQYIQQAWQLKASQIMVQ